jgi:hypothetical protein
MFSSVKKEPINPSPTTYYVERQSRTKKAAPKYIGAAHIISQN